MKTYVLYIHTMSKTSGRDTRRTLHGFAYQDEQNPGAFMKTLKIFEIKSLITWNIYSGKGLDEHKFKTFELN